MWGYIILQHMLSVAGINTQSLPLSSIITHIIGHFNVPSSEPPLDKPKELGEEIITS